MAVLTLLLKRQFREGLTQRRKVEKRIVTKPAGAARRCQKLARRLALKRGQGLATAGDGDHANVFSGMPARGKSLEGGNERLIVLLVVGVGMLAGRDARPRAEHGRIACGIDSRGAIEFIHGEPGVFRKHQFAWRQTAVILGFYARVGFECVAVLDWGG